MWSFKYESLFIPAGKFSSLFSISTAQEGQIEELSAEQSRHGSSLVHWDRPSSVCFKLTKGVGDLCENITHTNAPTHTHTHPQTHTSISSITAFHLLCLCS